MADRTRAPRWGWELDPVDDHDVRVVVQQDENGCGPACGEMLLRDRGLGVGQLAISALAPGPCAPEPLAKALEALSRIPWDGGVVAFEPDQLPEMLRVLCSKGSWAALLEPNGLGYVGHWVVVDAFDGDHVSIRDPKGCSYRVRLGDFSDLWHYTALVVEA